MGACCWLSAPDARGHAGLPHGLETDAINAPFIGAMLVIGHNLASWRFDTSEPAAGRLGDSGTRSVPGRLALGGQAYGILVTRRGD